ncbi:MAG: hypothetical protein ABIL42_00540 [candidate division WOR-3 bacterium]
MLWTISWVVAPVINDTIFKGDTCPGTAVHSALVGIPSSYACADIMFAFDLTGSMGGELSYAQANANAIMDSLMSSIPDVRFGVSSHSDYPASYSLCGYSATYGISGDFPYQLNQPLTYDTALVRSAIYSLSILYGADSPEDYARLLWEMLNDPGIDWRRSCARFVVFWLDDIPHACDIYDPSRPYWTNTGVEPGRDATAGTPDDIYWYPLLRDLRRNGIKPVIMVSATYTYYLPWWQYWMSDTLADGIATIRGSGIARQIDSIVNSTALTIDTLRPVVREPAYTSWVSFTPPYYAGITLSPPEDTFGFTITFNVPPAAPSGLHTFHIDYYRDAILVDSQLVNLWVYDCTAGYDDPIAVKERLSRDKVIITQNAVYVSDGYTVEVYSADGKRIYTLNSGKYEFRNRGIYFVRVKGGKTFKVVVR